MCIHGPINVLVVIGHDDDDNAYDNAVATEKHNPRSPRHALNRLPEWSLAATTVYWPCKILSSHISLISTIPSPIIRHDRYSYFTISPSRYLICPVPGDLC